MTNEKNAEKSSHPLWVRIVAWCSALSSIIGFLTMVFGPDGFLKSFSKDQPLYPVSESWETLSNTVTPMALCCVLIGLSIAALSASYASQVYLSKRMEETRKKREENKEREEEFARLKAQLSQEQGVND